MAYALPPWLAPVNPVPYAVQGFQQGESIAERQNRAELAIQEMTLRREQQQRLQEQANQEMAIQNQQAQERAKQAALKWQWQQELSGRVAQGEDPMKAWEATSTKYNPAGMAPYWHQKEATRMAEQRAAAAQKHQQAMEAFRERQLQATEKRMAQTEKHQTELEINAKRDALKQQLRDAQIELRSKKTQLDKGGTEEQQTALVEDINVATEKLRRIEKDLADTGAPVSMTPEGRLEMKPVVTTPPDMRGWKKVLPNFISRPPGPVTNMVPTMVTSPLTPPPLTATNATTGVTNVVPPMDQAQPSSKGKLTKDQAMVYLQLAKGDKDLARQLAKNDGWEL